MLPWSCRWVFKYVSSGAEFHDLNIINASITGTTTATDCSQIGFIGQADIETPGLKIENVEIELDITGNDKLGSLVGYISAFSTCILPSCSIEILNINTIGDVTGYTNVGGIFGEVYAGGLDDAMITEAEYAGTVSGRYNVGGIAGAVSGFDIAAVKATAPNADSANNLIELIPVGVGSTFENVGGIVGIAQFNPVNIFKAKAVGKIIATDTSCLLNCYHANVGGILGSDSSQPVVIKSVSSETDIIGNGSNKGGIVGFMGSQTSVIKYSHAYGDIKSQDSSPSQSNDFGGIVGNNAGKIDDSFYSVGTIEAAAKVGGIVGANNADGTDSAIYGQISNCFVDEVNVTGSTYVGGIVGYNQGKVLNSFTDATVNLSDNWLSPLAIGGIAGANIRNGSGVVAEISNTVSGGDIVQVSGSTYTDVDGLVGDLPGLNGTDYNISNAHYTEDMSGTFNFASATSSFTCGSNLTCSPFYTLVAGNPVHQLKSQIDFLKMQV